MEVTKIIKTKNSEELLEKSVLNVCAYARVSTEHEEQKNSFESQKRYYEKKILINENWNYVGIYADEGITGTSLDKRDNFNRMINDAMIGKIDMVLTKSISRFARNTIDTLKYVRLLRERNIAIIFEEENINTLTKNGEFLLTVLSSVAQQESENISAHVRKGHEMLLKNGKILLGTGCYGYKFLNKERKIEIVPEEAKVVKKIFSLFVEGYSIGKIKEYLEKNNIKTFRGNSNWDKTGLKIILTNEKYAGDLLQGKGCKLNPFVNRVKNTGQANKYLIKDFHKPIISRKLFDKAQEIIKTEYLEKYSHKTHDFNPLSYRIKCGFCGYSNNSTRAKKNKIFSACRNRKNNGRLACPESRDIHLYKIFNIINKGLKNSKNIIINSKIENLLYVKTILQSQKEIDENELYKKIIKFVLVGGYDCYNRPQPFMIRIVLFNNYPVNDYNLKKITSKEVMEIDTIKIYEGWVSQSITTYGPPGPSYKRTEISKVKVTVEVDNSKNCTLV